MLTIRAKIILSSTVVFGAMLVLFAFVIYQRVNDAEVAKLDARLESQADKIATELEEESDEAVPVDFRKMQEIKTEGLSGARLQIIDGAGKRLLADSLPPIDPGNAVREVMKSGIPTKHTASVGGNAYRCLWIRSDADANIAYVVQLAAPMDDIEARQRDLFLLFLVAIPSVLALAAASAWAITRAAFRPMVGMIRTVKEITGNNLHRRLDLAPARDEVHELGETLNDMINRIDRAFRSQRQFVADASHEIRTPLTVIFSELEFAAERVTDPVVNESLQTSLAEAGRLARLADGLLLLARSDASQLHLDARPLRLDELLLDCVQLAGTIAAKKRIDFRVHVDEAIEMEADREKLKSVILNLLENAVKYSPEETTVAVSLARKVRDDGKIVLVVEDHGIGIPEAALPRIFERFYRVDASRSQNDGNGLGLAIVQQLVALHRGSISVTSEFGKGSRFVVELPSRSSTL